jgi:hypothetical protein
MSDIGMNFDVDIGNKFVSDIGITDVDVGCRMSDIADIEIDVDAHLCLFPTGHDPFVPTSLSHHQQPDPQDDQAIGTVPVSAGQAYHGLSNCCLKTRK